MQNYINFLFTILNFKIKVKDKQRQSDDHWLIDEALSLELSVTKAKNWRLYYKDRFNQGLDGFDRADGSFTSRPK